MEMTISLGQTLTTTERLASSPSVALASPPAARKLLLVDDHELVRFGIRLLHPEIGGVPIRRVEAGSLRETLELNGRAGGVDAVLLDCKGLQRLLQFLHI